MLNLPLRLPNGPATQRGAGLIEVLIAVLVLSIGMLGMTGLQAWALRNSQSANERGLAVVQTHFIADAMRADRQNAMTGAFNIGVGDATPTGTTFAATAIGSWRASLVQAIGSSASGGIACGAGGVSGAICTITVSWNDSRGTEGLTAQIFTTQVEL